MDANDYEALLGLGQALHSTLDMQAGFDKAVPFLRQLTGCEGVSMAVLQPPAGETKRWLDAPGGLSAERADGLRRLLSRALDYQDPDRHSAVRKRVRVEQHPQARGGASWTAVTVVVHGADPLGLALASAGAEGVSGRHVRLLERAALAFESAVANCHRYARVCRRASVDPAIEGNVMAVIWLDADLRELERTDAASRLLEHHFGAQALAEGDLPDALLAPLRGKPFASYQREFLHMLRHPGALSALAVRCVPVTRERRWALVLSVRGLRDELAARLTPRLSEIAGSMLDGLSNEEIAARDGRSLATIKQQASEIYSRLGVAGRGGLLRLATDLDVCAAAPVLEQQRMQR